MNAKTIQSTSESKLAAAVRLMLAIIFLMTGAMKLLAPQLGEAWSGQLLAAGIPFYEISLRGVPVLELLLGLSLGLGFLARPAALVAIAIMIVATYAHVVVDDPSLFPLQPKEPIVPVVVIAMCLFTLWRGAGVGSMDLKVSRALS